MKRLKYWEKIFDKMKLTIDLNSGGDASSVFEFLEKVENDRRANKKSR